MKWNDLDDTPYVHGGRTREGLDCAGLVFLMLERAGIIVTPDNLFKPDGYHWVPAALPPRPLDVAFFDEDRGMAIAIDSEFFLEMNRKVGVNKIKWNILRYMYDRLMRLEKLPC